MGFFSKLKSFALPAIGIGLGIATGGAAFGFAASGMFGGALGGALAGGAIGSTASSMLGLDRQKVPGLPTPGARAAPAPTRREDTGANVRLGTLTKNQRVSGRSRGSRGGTDVLGRLGLGGLSI